MRVSQIRAVFGSNHVLTDSIRILLLVGVEISQLQVGVRERGVKPDGFP